MSVNLQLVQRRMTHQAYAGEFRFERTFDMELVRKIMTDPKVYRAMAEETTCPPSQFEAPNHDAIYYILAYDGEECLGLVCLIPENSVCFGIHLGLLPHTAWLRNRPVATIRAVFEWIWQETSIMRIVAKIPEFNRLALQLSRKVPMMEFGRNVMSFPKHGRLYNEILMGVSRPGVK